MPATSGGQSASLLFVNTVHPSDATTPRSLSRIRSHVAKHIRARGRQSHTAALPSANRSQKRIYRPQAKSAEGTDGDAGGSTQLVRPLTQESIVADAHSPNCPQPPGSQLVPCCARVDLDRSPARPLSDTEGFLLHHCTSNLHFQISRELSKFVA